MSGKGERKGIVMKRTSKRLLAGMAFYLTIVLISGCTIKGTANQAPSEILEDDGIISEMNAEIYKQEKLPLDYDGEEVRADLTHVDFIVRLSEDNGFYLEYNISGKNDEPPLTVNIQDGVLILEEKNAKPATYYSGVFVDGISNNLKTKKTDYTSVVTLYVPSDAEIKLMTNMGEGDMELHGINVKPVDIHMDEGDLDLFDMTIEGGNIILVNGDIVAENVKLSQNIQMQTENGDFSLELNPSSQDMLSIYANSEMDIEVSEKLGGKLSENDEKAYFERKVKGSDDCLTIVSKCGDIMID